MKPPPILACLLVFLTHFAGAARAADDTGPEAMDAVHALYSAEKYAAAGKAAQALVAARTQALTYARRALGGLQKIPQSAPRSVHESQQLVDELTKPAPKE